MTAHYRLLDLEIDVPRQRVSRDGQLLDVSGLSFQLLVHLLARGQRVVGFDELIQAVWAPAVVGEETVTQRVKLLRQALGDDARRPRYLRSVRGQGYQLVEPPLPLEAGAAALPATVAPPPRRVRHVVMAATVVTVVVVGGLAWFAFAPRPQPAAAAGSPALARAAYYAGIGQADNNERAIALYRQALAQSPDAPEAVAGLSRALSARTCLYNGDADQAQAGATLARGLLARQPDDAAAWAALGYARDCLGDMRAAIEGYEHAVRLRGDDDNSRASLAYLYQEQGRLADALQANQTLREPAKVRFREVQVARELELLGFVAAAERRHRANFELLPDNVFANIAWPQFLLAQGRLDEARTALNQAMARGTPHPVLWRLQGELALAAGDAHGASEAFAAGARLRPHQSLPATLAGLYAEPPGTAQWRDERIERLRRDTLGWPDAWLEAALLEQARGHPDEAVKALRQAVAVGFRDRAWLSASPLFAGLRGDAGFTALLAGIDRDVAVQRRQVEQAGWRPSDLRSAQRAEHVLGEPLPGLRMGEVAVEGGAGDHRDQPALRPDEHVVAAVAGHCPHRHVLAVMLEVQAPPLIAVLGIVVGLGLRPGHLADPAGGHHLAPVPAAAVDHQLAELGQVAGAIAHATATHADALR